MEQVLNNIRILDLSRVYAAPAGSMILADLGAEVIRVEAIGGTDSMREWAPYHQGESTYYLSANRNKRSITLNLKEEKGRNIFLSLVKTSDIVLENFTTGTMKRLGLDYDVLKMVNEKIILCSVTGFGQTGPLKDEPGFDPIIQAMSGLIDVTGYKEGEGVKVGVPIADILTSHYVVISILAALRMRDQAGVGQHIDLSLLDVQLSSLANVSSSYLNGGHETERLGNSHNNVVPYQVFPCKDRSIMLCVGNDRLFAKLCTISKREEWVDNPKYATNDARLKNREELVKAITAIFIEKPADDWITLFREAKIPAGKVNTVEEAFHDPQVKARKIVQQVADYTFTGSPLRFSALPITQMQVPPELGEHTVQFLKEELGFDDFTIAQLKENHII